VNLCVCVCVCVVIAIGKYILCNYHCLNTYCQILSSLINHEYEHIPLYKMHFSTLPIHKNRSWLHILNTKYSKRLSVNFIEMYINWFLLHNPKQDIFGAKNLKIIYYFYDGLSIIISNVERVTIRANFVV